MKNYLNCKLILFKKILNRRSTLISDSEIKPFKILVKIAQKRKLKLIDIKNEFLKIQTFPSEMKSEYKLKNLAMAIQAAKLCGLKERKLYNSVNKITDISGRLELIKKYPNDIKVFIDYAHTPDALLKTIKSLKLNYGHNISLVFGCGGNGN